MVSRRQFLRGSAAAALLSQLPLGRLARSQSLRQNLVVVFAYGGWDTTAVFDPKPQSELVDTPAGDWFDAGPLPLWRPDGLRSDAVEMLRTYGKRMAVANGVTVNSLVHEAGLQMTLTGAVGEQHPADIAARVAKESGADLPLPYLTNGSSARPNELAALAGSVGYSNQLSSLVIPQFAWPTQAAPFRPSADTASAVDSYLRGAHGELQAERSSVGPNAQKLADWGDALDRAARIERHALGGGFLADPELFYGSDPWVRAARALSEGFSRSVFIQDDGYWDTHGANQGQINLFSGLLEGLGKLMGALEGAGIADNTLVLVLSEMGRSPLLNDQQGKDHWPFTSAMWLGSGVQPTVLRGTDEGLVQRRLNLLSGEPDDNGHALHAADVLATTAHLLGLSADLLYPHGEVIHALVR